MTNYGYSLVIWNCTKGILATGKRLEDIHEAPTRIITNFPGDKRAIEEFEREFINRATMLKTLVKK